MKREDIMLLVEEVLKRGNWMIRRTNGGSAHGGFRWKEAGEWTEAPDFINNNECGFGLHGNGPNSSGYWTEGKDVDFCEVDTDDLVDLGDKVKCRKARILLRNELPKGLKVGGYLDLRNTRVTEIPEGLE